MSHTVTATDAADWTAANTVVLRMEQMEMRYSCLHVGQRRDS